MKTVCCSSGEKIYTEVQAQKEACELPQRLIPLMSLRPVWLHPCDSSSVTPRGNYQQEPAWNRGISLWVNIKWNRSAIITVSRKNLVFKYLVKGVLDTINNTCTIFRIVWIPYFYCIINLFLQNLMEKNRERWATSGKIEPPPNSHSSKTDHRMTCLKWKQKQN